MKKLLKKILQWISQNPPKYKFVFVLWEDANSDSSWNELSTIEQMLPTICISAVSYTHLRAQESRGLGDVYKRQV